jgi:hypothetical protein
MIFKRTQVDNLMGIKKLHEKGKSESPHKLPRALARGGFRSNIPRGFNPFTP